MTVTAGTVVVVGEVTRLPRTPDVFVLGGLVVAVDGGVVAVVLRIGVPSGGAPAGDAATGGDELIRRNGGEVVKVVPSTLVPFVVAVPTAFVVAVPTAFVVAVPTAFVVAVLALAFAVGTVVEP